MFACTMKIHNEMKTNERERERMREFESVYFTDGVQRRGKRAE